MEVASLVIMPRMERTEVEGAHRGVVSLSLLHRDACGVEGDEQGEGENGDGGDEEKAVERLQRLRTLRRCGRRGASRRCHLVRTVRSVVPRSSLTRRVTDQVGDPCESEELGGGVGVEVCERPHGVVVGAPTSTSDSTSRPVPAHGMAEAHGVARSNVEVAGRLPGKDQSGWSSVVRRARRGRPQCRVEGVAVDHQVEGVLAVGMATAGRRRPRSAVPTVGRRGSPGPVRRRPP